MVAAEGNKRLQNWIDSDSLTGIMIFLMFVFFLVLSVSALNNVSVPTFQYQGEKKDEKHAHQNRVYSNIWGKRELM